MFYTLTKWKFKASFISFIMKHTFCHEGLIQKGMNHFAFAI